MFVDEAEILVCSGRGGNGVASFRREKYIPRGGPDGGDGGCGGSVHIVAQESINTLTDFRYRHTFAAADGENGRGKQCSGKNGADLCIDVPVGTVIFDAAYDDDPLGDLVRPQQSVLVARGGNRGLGNVHFKSSVNQAPRRATLGTPGESRRLRLELHMLADVGLLGLPNAGKSSFLRAVSKAKPRVANYPFTTSEPCLGVVSLYPGQAFVVADIPGIIAGASQGTGLGLRFLRHLGRTRLLLHLLDCQPDAPWPIGRQVEIVESELRQYSDHLATRERWLVINKVDLVTEDDRRSLIMELQRNHNNVFSISALSGEGIGELTAALFQELTGEEREW